MKYFLLRRQKGQGCDYTIGCGIDFEQIHANSKIEAISEITDNPDNLWWIRPDSEQKMQEVCLLEVYDEFDLIPLLREKLAEAENHKAQLQAKAREEAERAQYEQLKKKFEK